VRTILPVKVLDANNQGTEFWLSEGIRYAVHSGAQVINLSLDFARNYVPGAAMRDALAMARDADVVVVAASGNTGRRVLYPAAFPDVISVGAFRLDASSGYAVTGYSGFGEALDLVGPGACPIRTSTTTASGTASWRRPFPAARPRRSAGGCSPALPRRPPHVSAAAAALIGNGVAPDTVRPLLQRTAVRAAPTRRPTVPTAAGPQLGLRPGCRLRRQFPRQVDSPPPQPLYADAIAALAPGREGPPPP